MVWNVLGHSVCGTSHLGKKTPCQDAHRYKTIGAKGEWIVIVVADGAGSAAHAERGADLACEEFLKQVDKIDLNQPITRETIVEIYTRVRQSLVAEAEYLNTRPRELACTVLLAIIGPELGVFSQIGDGAIIFRNGETYQIVFWPETSEYVNTTEFLTDEDFEKSIRFDLVDLPISEASLLTDGLQRLALDFVNGNAHQDFFKPLFQELHAANSIDDLKEPFRIFLNSDRINSRTDDDKTLVLAIRQP